MGNVIPVLINTDSMHDLVGNDLIADIQELCHGRNRSAFGGHDYYGADRMAGIALQGRNGVKVAPYSHSSETHLFMTEHTNLVELSYTYCDWRASTSEQNAKDELARIKQAERMLKDAKKRVTDIIKAHSAQVA